MQVGLALFSGEIAKLDAFEHTIFKPQLEQMCLSSFGLSIKELRNIFAHRNMKYNFNPHKKEYEFSIVTKSDTITTKVPAFSLILWTIVDWKQSTEAVGKQVIFNNSEFFSKAVDLLDYCDFLKNC